jgi:protein-disulfide isomerase
MKKVIFWAVIGVVGIGAIILVVASIWRGAERAANYDGYDINAVIGANADDGEIADHVRGNAEADLVVVEYGDFQCGGCAQSQPRVEKLAEEFGDRVAFVFRNFPLSGHQNSLAASSAVEAAGLQGLYWEMADLVFANQAVWAYASGTERTDLFVGYFEQVGGEDVDKFKDDMRGKAVKDKIAFDQEMGKRAGVTGTPYFYMRGESISISGAGTEEDFLNIFRGKFRELGVVVGGGGEEE